MTDLVVGLGNPVRGDDGVGIAVARRIATLGPPGVDVVETDDPVQLLEVWEGADRVVVVDAMRSDRPAGSTVAFLVGDTPLPVPDWATGGTHALGLGAVIELARALGRLPEHLVVVGVEAQSVATSTSTSPEVTASIAAAARLALDSLGRP